MPHAPVRAWSGAEVAARWKMLFTLPLLVTEHLNDKLKIKADTRVALELFILQRLGFSAAEFHKHMQAQAMTRGTAIGQVERLKPTQPASRNAV
jgi:hypothetical protein